MATNINRFSDAYLAKLAGAANEQELEKAPQILAKRAGRETENEEAETPTTVARSKDGRARLEPVFRDVFPFYFPRIGLEKGHVEPFLEMIRERFPIAQDERFRDLLPKWLTEFAGKHNLPVARIRAMEYGDILYLALRALYVAGANETNDQRLFRERAAAATFATVDEMLRFSPPDVAMEPEVIQYRFALYNTCRADLERLSQLLDVAVA